MAGSPGLGPVPRGSSVAMAEVTLRVNGAEHHMDIDTRISLLDFLREQLRLTGSKKGCDHGQCGACTVLIDGRRANACLILAVACTAPRSRPSRASPTATALHPLQHGVHRARRASSAGTALRASSARQLAF